LAAPHGELVNAKDSRMGTFELLFSLKAYQCVRADFVAQEISSSRRHLSAAGMSKFKENPTQSRGLSGIAFQDARKSFGEDTSGTFLIVAE
jgi:hypothetical protein